jgi:multidrug resistance efflux pump
MAEVRRQVSAPFQAQVVDVLVDPGEHVEADQPLVRLDISRVLLQKTQKENEYLRFSTQADEARTKGSIHEAMMIERQRDVVRADIELIDYKLEQSEIKAPIAGTVTQSRLDDLIGEVVAPEKPLLAVEDLNTIAATVLVPERNVARVIVGQKGTLSLSANPSVQIPFTVIGVTPASEVFQQRNVYRVLVTLDEQPDWLRPGMEGKSRIHGEWSNLFMIYTRPLFDAIRMRIWWF